MKEKILRFMRGRYGVDELSKFLMMLSMAMIIMGSLTGNTLVNLLGFAAIGSAYFRILSKDYYRCSDRTGSIFSFVIDLEQLAGTDQTFQRKEDIPLLQLSTVSAESKDSKRKG